jgi:hypothetical protein
MHGMVSYGVMWYGVVYDVVWSLWCMCRGVLVSVFLPIFFFFNAIQYNEYTVKENTVVDWLEILDKFLSSATTFLQKKNQIKSLFTTHLRIHNNTLSKIRKYVARGSLEAAVSEAFKPGHLVDS